MCTLRRMGQQPAAFSSRCLCTFFFWQHIIKSKFALTFLYTCIVLPGEWSDHRSWWKVASRSHAGICSISTEEYVWSCQISDWPGERPSEQWSGSVDQTVITGMKNLACEWWYYSHERCHFLIMDVTDTLVFNYSILVSSDNQKCSFVWYTGWA